MFSPIAGKILTRFAIYMEIFMLICWKAIIKLYINFIYQRKIIICTTCNCLRKQWSYNNNYTLKTSTLIFVPFSGFYYKEFSNILLESVYSLSSISCTMYNLLKYCKQNIETLSIQVTLMLFVFLCYNMSDQLKTIMS